MSILIDNSDEERVDEPFSSPSGDSMTCGGAENEAIETENENENECTSESENIEDEGEDEGGDCTMISMRATSKAGGFVGFSGDDENLISNADEDESGDVSMSDGA